MSLNSAERWVGRAGAVATSVTLAAVLMGLWRGLRRPAGRVTGREPPVLRTPAFYLLAGAGFFGLCYRLWRPVTRSLSRPARAIALALGVLFYFPGLALILWGRLTLGKLHDVSSSLGARLYADHRLVTHGPYALVRHPMYLGILLTGLGGLLIYRTWTFVFLTATFLGLVVRARREEQALAAEFGREWEAYRRQVPAWIPRFSRSK